MRVFAISDLHLSFSTDKPMDIFGEHWRNHPSKIEKAWSSCVSDDDLVLVPGDISWAMKLDEAAADFEFIDALPGRKVIIRGNHDYWWASLTKMKNSLPASIVPLNNSAFEMNGVAVAGTRLWVDPALGLENIPGGENDEKIWKKELTRLKTSLDALPRSYEKLVIMTHYPPISLDGGPGDAVRVASEKKIDYWIFGHMHKCEGFDYTPFNTVIDGTRFEFVSADFLDFKPRHLFDID